MWVFLKKLKTEYHMIQKFHFWAYIQRKWKKDLKEISAPPCSLQHYSRLAKICRTEMSINRWMDKDAVHIYNGTLFNHEKEGNPAICNNKCLFASHLITSHWPKASHVIKTKIKRQEIHFISTGKHSRVTWQRVWIHRELKKWSNNSIYHMYIF